jgi:c-di-GMP-binding flagellar brake protein YcgR
MSSKKLSGAERRTTKRYRQSGEAWIARHGSDIAYRGHILDLSLGGCLLALHDPSPFEFKMGMAVDVGIHQALVTFRAVATIRRISEDRSALGICFADMGRRARSDLLDLMAELEAAEAAEAAAAALHPGSLIR